MIQIDMQNAAVHDEDGRVYAMDSREAFAIISRAMLRCGWDNKYVYSFTWMGRPIIQLPDDMVRLQEVIYRVKPDVIIEIGIAHGGSLVFSASLCKTMDRGRVIGVDIDIRPHNRAAIEAHELYPLITLMEGDSVSEDIVNEVGKQINPGETVLAFLDGCHTKSHVLAELEAYGPMISKDSYIVAMDGIMKDLTGARRAKADWVWNNPYEAAMQFVSVHDEFVIEEPAIPFNEGSVTERCMTYWPGSFVKRIR